jgi:hypothetical protein
MSKTSPPAIEPFAFIVGMSRSGTTWMTWCLNRHPELAVFGETGYWGKHFPHRAKRRFSPFDCDRILRRMPGEARGVPLEPRTPERIEAALYGYNLRKLLNGLRLEILERGEYQRPDELFNRMCGVVAEYSGKPRVMEKTPHHVNWTERISRCYPGVKFIVTCRDPRGFMLSYKHQGDRMAENAREGFQQLYHPMGCALVYRGYARTINRLRRRLGDRMLLVRLEEVRRDPAGIMERVQRFLELPVVDNLHLDPVNTSFPSGERPGLDAEDRFWLRLLAAPAARGLGYEDAIAPAPLSAGLRSVSRLPAWGWRVARKFLSYQNANPATYVLRWLRG